MTKERKERTDRRGQIVFFSSIKHHPPPPNPRYDSQVFGRHPVPSPCSFLVREVIGHATRTPSNKPEGRGRGKGRGAECCDFIGGIVAGDRRPIQVLRVVWVVYLFSEVSVASVEFSSTASMVAEGSAGTVRTTRPTRGAVVLVAGVFEASGVVLFICGAVGQLARM